MLKFIVCTTIFLRPRRCPEPLLRFINLVAITLCSYRLLPVSRNTEAPAFNLGFHSKCLGACGIQHLPFLRTALSQSRNCSLRWIDFACFANSHTLHNGCCLEQSARRWELFAGALTKGSEQPLQLPSHGWHLLGCLVFQLGHPSALLEKLRCWTAVPKPCGHEEASGDGLWGHRGCAKGEVGTCVPVLAHSFGSL